MLFLIFFEGSQSYVHRYFLAMGFLILSTEILVPAALFVTSLHKPCMPPIISSLVVLNCTSWQDDGQAVIWFRVCVGLLEGYTWSVLCGVVSLSMYSSLLYPGEVLLEFTSLLERWPIVELLHLIILSTLCMYLIENYVLKFFREIQTNIYSILKYRHIQILTQLRNNVWGGATMHVCIWTIYFVECLALYVLISTKGRLPVPAMTLFSIVAFDLFIIIQFLFKVLSNPGEKTCAFLMIMKRKKMSNWVRKYLQSCQPSKLTKGNGTYFSKVSSLVTWQNCVDWLIPLLLM